MLKISGDSEARHKVGSSPIKLLINWQEQLVGQITHDGYHIFAFIRVVFNKQDQLRRGSSSSMNKLCQIAGIIAVFNITRTVTVKEFKQLLKRILESIIIWDYSELKLTQPVGTASPSRGSTLYSPYRRRRCGHSLKKAMTAAINTCLTREVPKCVTGPRNPSSSVSSRSLTSFCTPRRRFQTRLETVSGEGWPG